MTFYEHGGPREVALTLALGRAICETMLDERQRASASSGQSPLLSGSAARELQTADTPPAHASGPLRARCTHTSLLWLGRVDERHQWSWLVRARTVKRRTGPTLSCPPSIGSAPTAPHSALRRVSALRTPAYCVWPASSLMSHVWAPACDASGTFRKPNTYGAMRPHDRISGRDVDRIVHSIASYDRLEIKPHTESGA